MIGVVNILKNDAGVTTYVNSDNIFGWQVRQKITLDSIVVNIEGGENQDSKTGAGHLLTQRVQVMIYCKDAARARNTSDAVKSALQRVSPGTYNGEYIQYSEFVDMDSGVLKIANSDWYVFEHIYLIDIR